MENLVRIPITKVGIRDCDDPDNLEVGVVWLNKLLVFELPKVVVDDAKKRGYFVLQVPPEEVQ